MVMANVITATTIITICFRMSHPRFELPHPTTFSCAPMSDQVLVARLDLAPTTVGRQLLPIRLPSRSNMCLAPLRTVMVVSPCSFCSITYGPETSRFHSICKNRSRSQHCGTRNNSQTVHALFTTVVRALWREVGCKECPADSHGRQVRRDTFHLR